MKRPNRIAKSGNQNRLKTRAIKTLLFTILLMPIVTGYNSCGKKEFGEIHQPSLILDGGLNNGEIDGTSSGGGGFADESSKAILTLAKNEILTYLYNSSPNIYLTLPSGWTAADLAVKIENLRT